MFQVVIYYHSVSELLNTMPRGKKSTIIVLYTELRMLLINSVHLVDLCLVKKMVSQVANTKASDGYSVGTSGGRPSGTKASDGYSVSISGGRPSGTKASDGYSVGGRPSGTKASDGYSVSTSGG